MYVEERPDHCLPTVVRDSCGGTYGLRYFHGEDISVSFGRLEPGFYIEHCHERLRLFITGDNAWAEVQTDWDGYHRAYSQRFGANCVFFIPETLQTTFEWGFRADLAILYLNTDVFPGDPPSVFSIIGESLKEISLNDPCIVEFIQALWALSRRPYSLDAVVVEATGVALASLIMQQGYGGLRRNTECGCPLALNLMDSLIDFIDKELSRTISVTELARRAGLSRDHFSRRFKSTMGESPKFFILRRRLEKAKVLLSTGQLNVSETANAVGFQDAGYFSRCYRKLFNVPPKYAVKEAFSRIHPEKRLIRP